MLDWAFLFWGDKLTSSRIFTPNRSPLRGKDVSHRPGDFWVSFHPSATKKMERGRRRSKESFHRAHGQRWGERILLKGKLKSNITQLNPNLERKSIPGSYQGSLPSTGKCLFCSPNHSLSACVLWNVRCSLMHPFPWIPASGRRFYTATHLLVLSPTEAPVVHADANLSVSRSIANIEEKPEMLCVHLWSPSVKWGRPPGPWLT